MIVLIILLEATLLFLYVYNFEVLSMLTSFLFLWYAISFRDGHEFTGFRTWPWIKRFALPLHIAWASRQQVLETNKKRLFVVKNNVTSMALLAGFGFNGKKMLNTVYMMPHGLFYVPLIRDLLLWSGAVSNRTDVLELMDKGWSVCTCYERQEDPDISIFEYAHEKRIEIVPVSVEGEREQMFIFKGQWQFTQWCERTVGWPFPFIFFPKRPIMALRGHCELTLCVGIPMNPVEHENASSMETAYHNMLSGNVQITNDETKFA